MAPRAVGRNAPSSRFSSTVSFGNRRRPSGTRVMPRSTISSVERPMRSWRSPSISATMLPDEGRTIPITHFISVLLPLPLVPSSTTVSAFDTDSEMSSSARQFELAHFDLGQVARQPPRLVGEADLVQQLLAARLDLDGGQAMAVPRVDREQQRHPDVVGQVQRVKRLRQLEAAGETEPGALMRDQAVERMPVEDDAAGLVAQGAAEAIDQGALAGTVRANQAEPLAGRDAQIDAFQRDETAEALADSADSEDRPIRNAGVTHAAAWRCIAASSTARTRARRRACTSPTMPFGATMTKPISKRPTISRFSAEEIVTVANCWIVPSRIAPMIGPTQLVMPPITGIATLLTA